MITFLRKLVGRKPAPPAPIKWGPELDSAVLNRGQCPDCGIESTWKTETCVFSQTTIECDPCGSRYAVMPCFPPYTRAHFVGYNRIKRDKPL